MPRATPARRGFLRVTRDALAFAAVKAGFALVSILPPGGAYALARVAGGTLFRWSRRRRHIALRNLDIAYRSSLSSREKQRLASLSFQHAMASGAGFAIRDRRARAENLASLFSIDAADDRLLREPGPNGIAFLSSHTGDWEMAHHYLALRGIPVAVVTREISNRLLDREIARRRSSLGARTIPKRGALAELRRTLRRGEAVGLLADQNCPARSRFFEFLGVPASTYTDYARLLVRSGARVLFIACLRDGFRFRFRIIVREIEFGVEEMPGERTVERVRRAGDALVRRYLSLSEELIANAPEQHLWMHRRWKSRPTGAAWLYHDLGKPLDLALLAQQNAVER